MGFPRAPLSWKDRPYFITANCPWDQSKERGSSKALKTWWGCCHPMLHSCSHQQSLQVIHHHRGAYHQVALKTPGLAQSLSPAISKLHTFSTSVNVVFLFLLSVVVSWWSLFSCGPWKWHYFSPSALYPIPSCLPYYLHINSLSFEAQADKLYHFYLNWLPSHASLIPEDTGTRFTIFICTVTRVTTHGDFTWVTPATLGSWQP